MGSNTLDSWCFTRLLFKRGLFATPMYHDMGEMWRLTLHTLYYTCRAPNYKTIFFTERGNRTHRYMLEPIPLSAIWTIASGLGSHALWCEMGSWGTSDKSGRLCTLFPKQVRESEYHWHNALLLIIIWQFFYSLPHLASKYLSSSINIIRHTYDQDIHMWEDKLDNYMMH